MLFTAQRNMVRENQGLATGGHPVSGSTRPARRELLFPATLLLFLLSLSLCFCPPAEARMDTPMLDLHAIWDGDPDEPPDFVPPPSSRDPRLAGAGLSAPGSAPVADPEGIPAGDDVMTVGPAGDGSQRAASSTQFWIALYQIIHLFGMTGH